MLKNLPKSNLGLKVWKTNHGRRNARIAYISYNVGFSFARRGCSEQRILLKFFTRPITQILPRKPQYLSFIILKNKDQLNNPKQYVVNRKRVLIVLQYLCNNNPSYKANGIKIDYQRLHSFPVNDVPLELNSIVDRNDIDIK